MNIVIIMILVLLILVIWYISVNNKLNRMLVKIDEASSGIDVASSILTKMMDTVRAYAKHEKETLFEVINLRKGMTLKEKSDANNKMNYNFDKIQVIAEAYPELKSSENYKTLQQSILEVEEHLQAARRMYNANVSAYNQAITVFPNSLIANSRNFVKKDFFEAEGSKKQDVKIDLN